VALDDELQRETTDLLARLIRFDTVNPPGNERPAIEFLARYLADAGLETELLGAEPGRPNLIATLSSGGPGTAGAGSGDPGPPGPVLCYLGHVDTVLADASEWRHDPWSGEVVEGFVWGRGAIDMKSQVAAEAVAAASLARDGWRPARGALRLVFVVDEETGGELGAQWLTSEHPDRVRCDLLVNEGAGTVFEYGGRRRYGVCCGEKGVFRFTLTAHGAAGHASLPAAGDNALLKLGPVLERLAAQRLVFALTDGPAALLASLGEDPGDPAIAAARLREREPTLAALLEPMLGVTLTPTMAQASGKVNVIPSRASIRVDCRVPPGLGEDEARRAVDAVLGDVLGNELSLSFDETVVGNVSPSQSALMDSISNWVAQADPGAEAVPVILPGFSDSRWFRSSFPDCIAYGFFPQRHMTLQQAFPLMHNADERIDVRDLGFAAGFYVDLARELLS
jgi:acetylornithine deacetylase/succinyl-diaminopimelate desuccinylase-like protein